MMQPRRHAANLITLGQNLGYSDLSRPENHGNLNLARLALFANDYTAEP